MALPHERGGGRREQRPMYKNVPGQGVYLYASVFATGAPDTGDAANITGQISQNGGAAAALSTTNPTEIGGGVYWQPLSQGETNADEIAAFWSSTTAGVVITTAFVDTLPGNNVALQAQLADAVPHGGTPGTSTATLALQRVQVQGANGAGGGSVQIGNTTAAGAALALVGDIGLLAQGGSVNVGEAIRLVNFSGDATTPTISIIGGANESTLTAGNGITVLGGTGRDGIFAGGDGQTSAFSGAGHGICAVGGANAGGSGLSVEGHGGGAGIWVRAVNDSGGSSPGFLVTVDTGNAPGMSVTGSGVGAGIMAIGGTTVGPGMTLRAGGGTGSPGLQCIGDGGGEGIASQGGATGSGVFFGGSGTKPAILAAGGATGPGVRIVGGSTSGNGITVQTTSGHGIDLTGVAGVNKYGIDGSVNPTFLDNIEVETGLNLRQANSLQTAAAAGVLTGANTTTIIIRGAGVATTRIVATVDSFGDRSALTLTPPP